MFVEGTKVRLSGEALFDSYYQWVTCKTKSIKKERKKYLNNCRKKGIIIEVSNNNYKILWDDNTTSICPTYMIDKILAKEE